MPVLIGLGIDPGLKGALATVAETPGEPLSVTVWDMPTLDVVVSGKTRQRVDRHGLDRLVRGLALLGITFAVQEKVWARPLRRKTKAGTPFVIKPDAGSAMQLGLAAGASLQALACYELPHDEIPPADWKKALGVSADKEEARGAASRLLPGAAHLWPLVKHDGRAEAALLGLYALRFAKGLL